METGELYVSDDCWLWEAALDAYSKVLRKKASETSKNLKSKSSDLVELDEWFQNTLPVVVMSRSKPHVTHSELCKLMKWKLTRGKFRPRLTEMVQRNQPEEVKDVTEVAFQCLPDIQAAIKHLCQLKAVGPATASAMLCVAAPTRVPFMADESMSSVPGLGKLEYTMRYYMQYVANIQEKVDSLNTSGSEARAEKWTCHEVEKALWAHYLAKKYGIAIETPTGKRARSKLSSPPPAAKRDK